MARSLNIAASHSASLLSEVRSLPQIRLQPTTEVVTSVVFRKQTIATIDHRRAIAEIAVPAADVHELLARHDGVTRGRSGIAIHVICASRIHIAVGLILRRRDEILYGWQLLSSSP